MDFILFGKRKGLLGFNVTREGLIVRLFLEVFLVKLYRSSPGLFRRLGVIPLRPGVVVKGVLCAWINFVSEGLVVFFHSLYDRRNPFSHSFIRSP